MNVTGFLDEAGIDFEVLEHKHTERAVDEATALGAAPEQVAKTLVLTTPGGNVRAVLPASAQVDLRCTGAARRATGRRRKRARARRRRVRASSRAGISLGGDPDRDIEGETDRDQHHIGNKGEAHRPRG